MMIKRTVVMTTMSTAIGTVMPTMSLHEVPPLPAETVCLHTAYDTFDVVAMTNTHAQFPFLSEN